jgi:A/G-specific adenine glycosylase
MTAAADRQHRGRTVNDQHTVRLQTALQEWGEVARRDLPWRRTRDPWAILVSEVMLAQTQVARVIPKWEGFLARWPNPARCAAAPVGEVIAAWNGLGYNRRAVFLHGAAVAIATTHQGVVPADRAALMALPGVGAYTARAVQAFAFDHPVGVVDTNAARVLARAVAGRRLDGRAVQELADRMVPAGPSGSGWAWNQAMLDLGAGVCTARRPACHSCPLGPGSLGAGPRPGGPARSAAPAGPGRTGLCAWVRLGGPDPAAGSAGTSRPQSAFAGSDRQGRGRLLAHLASGDGTGRLAASAVAAAAGWPDQPARAALAARSLVEDGLAVTEPDGSLRLP